LLVDLCVCDIADTCSVIQKLT